MGTDSLFARTPRLIYKQLLPLANGDWVVLGKVLLLEDEQLVQNLDRQAFSNFFRHRGKRLEIQFQIGSNTWSVKTDDGGSFHQALSVASSGQGLASVSARIKFPGYSREEDLAWNGPASPSGLIISDVDDTVQVTNVRKKTSMLWKTFAIAPEKRAEVSGTPELYRQMVMGTASQPQKLLAFVSASPMYLAPQLEAFFQSKGFPPHALFVREFGIKETLEKIDGKSGSVEEIAGYKDSKISWLLDSFPGLKAILLGDSGERDPETYSAIVSKYPHRIQAVIIHNVTGQSQDDVRYSGLKKQTRLVVWKDPQQLLENLLELNIIVPGR